MTFTRRVSLAILIGLLLSGCVQPKTRQVVITPASADQKYGPNNIENILAYARELVALKAEERRAECLRVLDAHHQDQRLTNLLRLFLAQLLTEGCGDVVTTSGLIEASLVQIEDERLQSFLLYAQEWLARMDHANAQRRLIERKLAKVAEREEKTQQQMKSQANLIRLLQQRESQLQEQERQVQEQDTQIKALKAKLDALKSIEQDLGEPRVE